MKSKNKPMWLGKVNRKGHILTSEPLRLDWCSVSGTWWFVQVMHIVRDTGSLVRNIDQHVLPSGNMVITKHMFLSQR